MEAEATEPLKRPKRPQGSPRGVSLTEKERQAYDLRYSTDPPMPWRVMSRHIKRDHRGCQRSCANAEAKLGLGGKLSPHKNSLQAVDPALHARVVAEFANPDSDSKSVSDISRRTGVDRLVVERIAKNLSTGQLPIKMEARNVSVERMKRLWGTVGERALEAMSDEKFEDASLYQLGTVAGIATDKLLLLRALPSQVVRSEADRVKLEVLAQAFMHEAEVRGYKLTADSSTGVIDMKYTRDWRAQNVET